MESWLIKQFDLTLDEMRTRLSFVAPLYLIVLAVIAACYKFYLLVKGWIKKWKFMK